MFLSVDPVGLCAQAGRILVSYGRLAVAVEWLLMGVLIWHHFQKASRLGACAGVPVFEKRMAAQSSFEQPGGRGRASGLIP